MTMPNKPAPLALHQIDGLARSLLPMFDGTRPFFPSDKANIETLVRAIPDLVREILDLTADIVAPVTDAPLTTEEAALVVGLSAQTLNKLRHEQDGPPYIKHARRVVYRRSDLEAWMQSRRRVPVKGSVKIRREIVITPEFVQDCVDAGVGEAVLKELDTPSDSLSR